jgi:Na+-transporting NADH:ubiquinone oxidoreductase subunit C
LPEVQRNSTIYTLGFAGLICVVCSVLVAASAVILAPRQALNRAAYRQKNILLAVGVIKEGQSIANEEVAKLFDENIQTKLVDLKTGEYVDTPDPKTYDQRRAQDDPAQSIAAEDNASRVKRIPKLGLVYQFVKDGKIDAVVVPIEGYGLWGTLYGFLALDKDTTTVRGITYYEHIETPGLGGEVDNPRWKALWPGRKAYDESWKPAIKVVKGAAGPVAEAPHSIDGLSGATITSNGVTNMMDFWLGENGYAQYLAKFRENPA